MEPVPFEAFLVRPSQRQGESLVGWLYRYYADNGRSPPYFVSCRLSVACKSLYNPARRLDVLQELKCFLGDRCRVMPESWASWCGQDREWTVRYLRTFRFCPECLSEQGIHLELWNLPGVNACPRHGNWIVDRCATCGRSVTWEDFDCGFVCKCGQNLAALPAKNANLASLRFSRAIACSPNVPLPTEYYFSCPEEVNELEMSERYLLLSWFVRTLRRQQRKIYKPLTDNFHELTSRECRWVCHWPYRWRRFSRLFAHHAATGSDAPTVLISGEKSVAPYLARLWLYVHRFGSPDLISRFEPDIFSYAIVAHGDWALLVNPRSHPSGDADLLSTFSRMWQSISWMPYFEEEPIAQRGNFPSSNIRRQQAFAILHALFLISDKGFDPPALSKCWIPSRGLQRELHPRALPRLLFSELYALHPRIQRQIASLLEASYGISVLGIASHEG